MKRSARRKSGHAGRIPVPGSRGSRGEPRARADRRRPAALAPSGRPCEPGTATAVPQVDAIAGLLFRRRGSSALDRADLGRAGRFSADHLGLARRAAPGAELRDRGARGAPERAPDPAHRRSRRAGVAANHSYRPGQRCLRLQIGGEEPRRAAPVGGVPLSRRPAGPRRRQPPARLPGSPRRGVPGGRRADAEPNLASPRS